MNTTFDAATSAKKKGKILVALKLYQKLYADEKTEKLERSLFELEEEVIKKFNPKEEHSIQQAIENKQLEIAAIQIERLKQERDLKVWPLKKQVECLKVVNKTDQIMRLLKESLYLTGSEKLLLGQLYLKEGEGLKAFLLCQGILSCAPDNFVEDLKSFFQKWISTEMPTPTDTAFNLSNKGFNWLMSFLKEESLFTVSFIYLKDLHIKKNWSEGRTFLKNYFKKFPHETRFDWAHAQFTWWATFNGNRPLEASQKEMFSRLFRAQGVQAIFSQDSGPEQLLYSLMDKQGQENDFLLLEYNPFTVFGLVPGHTNTEIMKGMRQALSQKKVSPRVLLTLQRLLLQDQHHALIHFLHAPPFHFVQ